MATKVRFDGLDVQAMVAHLQGILGGRRVVNIYDGFSGESYIFKLEGDANKFLLVESGIRFHPLQNFSAESTAPSPFASKLRKHLRGLRIEKVVQIGQDRVVMFQFGSGEYRHSVILELYAKGNLILTDKEYKVLALLRSHVYHQGQESAVAVQVGQVYPVSYATNLAADGKETAVHLAEEAPVLASVEAFNTWARKSLLEYHEKESKKTKKKKKSTGLTLKMLLSQHHESGVTQLGPALVEHCILNAGLEPNTNLVTNDEPFTMEEEKWKALHESLKHEGPRILGKIKDDLGGGYILCRPQEGTVPLDENLPNADKIFEEFLPFRLKQHEERLYIECDNFGTATEEYFERVQMQKAIQKAVSAEKSATNRLEKVRTDQQQRLDVLVEQQESLSLEAQTVQMHADNVEKALAVINSALDSGMDWHQLEQVVSVEQENKNPIALLIQKLLLDDDAMVLRLPTASLNFEDDDETIDVKILLKETAHGNANLLFERYRALKEKAEKTVDSSEKALRAAEETARKQLEEAKKRSKQSIVATTSKKKPFWFEKFHWFITSDNYLVLGGKDAHQNEQLVKKYLRQGDAYLHADVHGAASCILRAKRRRKRNNTGTEPIPLSEQSLREAGHFTICRSSAWSSRMVTSAWWVEAHQVSKTAPSGEYLTVGSFMVRGKKTFLPPSPLEMGFAVMFRLGDPESIQRHKNERRDFTLLKGEESPASSDEERPDSPKPSRLSDEEQPAEKESSSEENGTNEPNDFNDESQGDPLDKSQGDTEPIGQTDTETLSEETVSGIERSPEAMVNSSDHSKQRRGLSAKDRKLIKKFGSLEAAAKAKMQQTEENQKPSVGSNPTASKKTEPPKPKRGKKAKDKRAMRKYADQDDEERELAMLALHGGSKSKKEAKKNDSRLKHSVEPEKLEQVAVETVALLTKDSAQTASLLDGSVRELISECLCTTVDGVSVVKWSKIDADVLEQLMSLDSVESQTAAAERLLDLKRTTRVDNFSSSLAGVIRAIRKHGFENMTKGPATEEQAAKRKTKESRRQEEAKWQSQLQSEGIVQGDGDEDLVDDTEDLNRLTGKPHPDDVIVSAVPVCAPYNTLNQFTYRVKLTPGGMKRGKASKQCVDLFLKQKTDTKSAASQKESELIKQLQDNDWVQVICADVKIATAGASKMAKKQKANKKRK